jgi:cytochrome oxidase Cu insertion factor (SCO1/SenC/PrrC family)
VSFHEDRRRLGMRKAWGVLGRLSLAVAACGLFTSPAPAQTTPAAQGAAELKVGDEAPDFTLPATDGKTYTLSKDLRGKWVVLAWFPKAFTAG